MLSMGTATALTHNASIDKKRKLVFSTNSLADTPSIPKLRA
jgi:hypothetical protein